MLLLVKLLKLVAEIALMAAVAQALVGVLAGALRAQNPAWRILGWLLRPFESLVLALGWRQAKPSQVRGAALALLLVLWLAATVTKIVWCLRLGVQACQ